MNKTVLFTDRKRNKGSERVPCHQVKKDVPSLVLTDLVLFICFGHLLYDFVIIKYVVLFLANEISLKEKKNVFLAFYNLEGKNDSEKLLIYVSLLFTCILYIKFINYDNYVSCQFMRKQ